jgi:RecJ-like exonuclease
MIDCWLCSGSGEGRYDGSRCPLCHGHGELRDGDDGYGNDYEDRNEWYEKLEDDE